MFNRFLDGNAALSLETWASFWYLPAAFAAGVLLFFLVAFRDEIRELDADGLDQHLIDWLE